MIDPFFFDRLMHAFTTANSTPLSRAAGQAATSRCTPDPAGEASGCRALREAEAVAADALRRDQPMHSGTPQADSHA
jgi:hypothetical protein